MDTVTLTNSHLLCLLQLASPALPVGAYSYSEGLETLVENGTINDQLTLQHWLESELRYGTIRLEAAVMVRAYQSAKVGDFKALCYWNAWLSAARETEELRASSWQMGRSLIRLLTELQPQTKCFADAVGNPCNYAIAFGIAVAHWDINIKAALLGYLHSWVTNLITGGVKLIPLGQTAGQQLLLFLQPLLTTAVEEVLSLEDDELSCCSWGLSLASMKHQTLYTRLFRS
ncbi:urease accessory protein UreF [Aetokthonos hydrillicola Thurmond2011]|jgi:urease accessory protein|uniref:Urease accessory protein UreF n=1 Tax=Aetokthonos hydrillicola Thurmond2011 TaxID=2712845 RepID=A0AAP5IHW8_9CYAN|nr:urease accessory protein UreF [Aetokthonos hydrillicola]MBO3459610.1 urease accessory protein UreF [Aetokthonos hydrillicola CCALA 1050]MBW4588972.1 urease accessory protein UreF [Aetokthonos hydrillicola CCALA 1050]MDR9900045.1 urease accessory protein UreF [Aetokthonos hydrillicola Thurmond2011]